MDKLLLVDGNSIMNRAFYGLPLLTDSKGRFTNAVFGFINILLRTIDDEKPSHVLIAFDSKAPTFRHKTFAEYKGTRKGMPDELRVQMPLVKEVLEAMDISMYEQEGIEADDILGTLSLNFENRGVITVLSGDRDMLQLASDKTKVSIPRTSGGQTTTEHFFSKDFISTYGFTPNQFIDVKGMMGDSSDNIPGIPGIGEKSAHKFIKEYGSLEGLYEHLDDLKGKTKEKIVENKELAFLSRELATIKRDCEIPLSLESMTAHNFLNEKAFALFKELEFTRLLSRFDFTKIEEAKETVELDYKIFEDLELYIETLEKVIKNKKVAFFDFIEGDYISFVFAIETKKVQTRFLYEGVLSFLEKETIINRLFNLFMLCEKVVFYDFKAFLHRHNVNDRVNLPAFDDVFLMYYLVKPNKENYPLLDLGLNYTDITLHNLDELIGKGKARTKFSELPKGQRHNYMAQAVTIIHDSQILLTQALDDDNMLGLYNTLEKPLLIVLYSMEREGIHVDIDVLKEQSDGLGKEIDVLTKNIYELAGEEFNINSPKQLGVVLFDNLNLPSPKKTKTGYSTGVDILEKLKDKHPIINQVLHYRQLTKLKSTYTDGLFNYVQTDGKIHTTFNQTIASTGRLSSTEPNLQNIPIRLEQGRLIRKAFVPKDGHVFIDADYSQIELRLLAHISEDAIFIEAYKNNLDIHRMTASQVFHVPFDEVTDTMRRNAKAVNFGIVYGISDYGLSRDLDIPIFEAREYIKAYFEKYPQVKAFLDLTVAKAYADGYVTTMYNRKRLIPELSSSNYMQRSFGERIAMNTPIQGSAADIIKIAMIKVYNRIKREKLQSKLILQVHDELIIEAPLEEKEYVIKLLVDEMEKAVNLLVPLTVDAKSAKDWYEAK